MFGKLRVRLGDRMQAFELMSERALRYVCDHIPDSRLPLSSASPWFALLDAADTDASAPVEDALMVAVDEGLVSDAVVAKSEAERKSLWRLRHSISEAQKFEGASLKHDVSVPVGEVARFIDSASQAVEQAAPGARVVAFGHVGDGNVHFNVSQPRGGNPDEFLAQRERIAGVVYDVVDRFRGSISAEHGVGVLKRDELRHYRGSVEVGVMRAIKRCLDPQNLLNPGKVL